MTPAITPMIRFLRSRCIASEFTVILCRIEPVRTYVRNVLLTPGAWEAG